LFLLLFFEAVGILVKVLSLCYYMLMSVLIDRVALSACVTAAKKHSTHHRCAVVFFAYVLQRWARGVVVAMDPPGRQRKRDRENKVARNHISTQEHQRVNTNKGRKKANKNRGMKTLERQLHHVYKWLNGEVGEGADGPQPTENTLFSPSKKKRTRREK
jgi:hypothetical protein